MNYNYTMITLTYTYVLNMTFKLSLLTLLLAGRTNNWCFILLSASQAFPPDKRPFRITYGFEVLEEAPGRHIDLQEVTSAYKSCI